MLKTAALQALTQKRLEGDRTLQLEQNISQACKTLIEEVANLAVELDPRVAAFLFTWAKTQNDGHPTELSYAVCRDIMAAYVQFNQIIVTIHERMTEAIDRQNESSEVQPE